MWKNFMTSIGLLTIALMAALYSSGAGRSGNVATAAISALLALIIAVWVGIRFVPRLASRVDWEWLPFVSRYHVTREGWIFLGAVTVVVFAAINTANNLLYMVLAVMLAVLVTSGFLSALNFRFLRIAVRIPSRCYAGEAFPLAVQIHNEKRVFPAFSLFLEPTAASPFRFSTVYVPVIRNMQHSSQTGQAMLSRRGRYPFREVKMSSRYPFGFFRKDRTIPVEGECLCYPEILSQEQIKLGSVDPRGSIESYERGLGHDLYMIRDYVPSDDARRVHWKASAKTSALKTREYAAEESRQTTIAFDRFGHPGDLERFETLVSQAASIAYHLSNEGIDVKFVTDEWQSSTLDSILEYLATVQLSADAQLPPADDAPMKLSLRG